MGGHTEGGRPEAGTRPVAARQPTPILVPTQFTARVVRVVPDVSGVWKAFDYCVPEALEDLVSVGASVRVRLHNRNVSGWVVADNVEAPEGVALQPLLAVRGIGPPPPVVDLAHWAAWRWAGHVAHLLRSASSPTLVKSLPTPLRPAVHAPPGEGADVAVDAGTPGTTVVRVAPAHDPFAVVVQMAGMLAQRARPEAGVLVLSPSQAGAARLATRLGQVGLPVALLPGDWALARAGGCVAVGARSGAWAPLPVLCAAVVVDAHAEAYHEERSPTWCAWQVVAERARRDGAPCLLVSPCPTLEVLAAGPLVTPTRARERSGWATVEVADRRVDDPRTGLYSPRLVELVRWAAQSPGRRVLCVLNRRGRVRVAACAACGSLARCERCGAALQTRQEDGAEILHCGRCGEQRPVVCAQCTGTRLKALRIGVSRVREELEALARAPVMELSGPAPGEAPAGLEDAPVVVGTEAVLHRIGRADAVVFLDFDAELLAPYFGAAEHALALVARACRVVGARLEASSGRAPDHPSGTVVLQTRQPEHYVARAASTGNPALVAEAEMVLRRELGLPPCTAMARLSGPDADAVGSALADAAPAAAEVNGPVDGTWSLRAVDHDTLCDLLASVPRPWGRVRVEVDPVRA